MVKMRGFVECSGGDRVEIEVNQMLLCPDRCRCSLIPVREKERRVSDYERDN